jgi:hypothetical protein
VSQIILDEQIFDTDVLIPLTKWITAQRLRDVRPDQVIKDERVPMLLRELRQAQGPPVSQTIIESDSSCIVKNDR